MLYGRGSERSTIDGLVEAVRAGRSGALVVRGEPGVGKTALMEYAIETAPDLRVVRAVGMESEMELPFAALHQICLPLLAGLDALPPPQREALRTAFGLSSGDRPDRLLVGLAVLSVLCNTAETRPLLCLVDDAQWLDRSSAQVLSFVARRLQAESVVILFGVRDQDEPDELAGLPELRLERLSYTDARALFASANIEPLDNRVRDRIIAEARGNPLALLELPRGLSAGSLAGGFALPDGSPLPSRIEASYRTRVRQLPAETQRLLLVAAAEPIGDPTLLWRAADELGIPMEAASPAEADDLMQVRARVTFRHPLLRSAIYRAASPEDRRDAHRVLAGVTDPGVDPDRRAWHRAHAALAPDEEVAAELELSAGRAQTRGGLAAAAAFLEEAAGLTPDPVRRGHRALAAAQAKHLAGAPGGAFEMLAVAQAGPLNELQRARVDLIHAQIAFAARRGSDAPALLLQAARQLEILDIGLARETYLEAFMAAIVVGRLPRGAGGMAEVARATRGAPAPSTPPRAPDLLLDGLALLVTEGCAAGAPTLRRALCAFRSRDILTGEGPRWRWLAGIVAVVLWDDETWHALATRNVEVARETGELTALPVALRSRILEHVTLGELDEAAALGQELQAVTAATRSQLAAYGALGLAAWRGRETEASELIEASINDATSRGEGSGVTWSHYSAALIYNGLGRYAEAFAAAERACEYEDLPTYAWSLTELIEAAARSGRREVGAVALRQLEERTRASGTDWAVGIETRSRALLSEGAIAESLYREAIHRLGRTRIRPQLARAHLLYGEWLRRENRRVDAREELRTAHELFTAMGIEGFAERTRRELLATGETVRRRSVDTLDELTAQEAQIARLAGDGRTNPEIGAELFLSSRTVEWHLRKVFGKLGVRSRKELRRAVSDTGRVAVPA